MRRIKIVSYKRKRQHKTNYAKRRNLLAGNMPRLVVRKSLNNINAQIVNFGEKGDKVVASASSIELKKYGWNFHTGNLPSAYLTGLLIGNKASHHKIKKVILDIGLSHSVPGSSPYALVKGALDAGLEIPHSSGMLPNESRLQGHHIVEYAKHAKGNQFANYKRSSINVHDLSKELENVKSKILKETEHGKKAK